MSLPGPPAAESVPDALRIVVFGLPAAGKTSLLGALARSARSQENLLNGRLTDMSNRLAELQETVYDARVQRTAEEIVYYPVDFEPFPGSRPPLTPHEHLGAAVIDSDGRVANELLARREILGEASREGTLARELIGADSLLLVVDASGTLPQVDADFAEFDRFLRLLEQDRGERTEVGGLPVFLVLTKCDLLARPGDTSGSWMERIEERKRDVDTLFSDFLARAAKDGRPTFGHLDLHLWATAVKRPPLANAPAREREPFGVAELFRQCLEQAALFRSHRQRSSRRLFWMAGTAGGLAAVMLALMIVLAVTNGDSSAGGLRTRVEEIRFYESPSAAERLRGSPSELRRRLVDLAALREDPGFPSLPRTDRDYLLGRIDELETYIAYYERVRQVPQPADVASNEKLGEVAEALQSLPPPREDWSSTEAALERADRLAEVEALSKAIDRAKRWYDEAHDKARDLWSFARYEPSPAAPAIDWHRWYDEVSRLLDPAYRLPFEPEEEISGTSLKYATALHFERAVEARAEWEAEKDRLLRVLDVAAALGLLTDVRAHPALLVIARPPGFPLDRARIRLRELQEAYPRYRTEFVVTGLPDAMVTAVRQAARANLEYLLEPAREAVLRQLRKADRSEETVAGWKEVGEWLGTNPQELAAWRALALVLARLNDANATDAVSALISFLQKRSFPIEIHQLSLEVPYRYSDVKPLPGADLEIFHNATTPDVPAISCGAVGEGKRDDERRVTTYTFRPRERQRLIYRPGEELRATLHLRDEGALTWSRSHSAVYQFERLLCPPRLHRVAESSDEGTLAEGIELLVTPDTGVPGVPALMPFVQPK
jgi:GTPase SAR1 family protein